MILRSAASGQLVKVAHKMGTDLKTVYCRVMNKTPYTDPCTYAMQSDMNRLKEEIIDCYGEETWTDMNS